MNWNGLRFERSMDPAAPLTAGKRWARAWRALVIAVAALTGWMLLAWLAAQALIVRAELAEADALVVLAGSGTYLERAQRAAQLFNEGRAPRILLTNDGLRSGWSAAEERNPLFAERAAAELRRRGVPGERIEIIAPVVASTFDEAVLLREQATARGWRSLIVVTSAYHSRRARWTLRCVFHDSGIAIGLAPAAPGQQAPAPAAWWLSALGWEMVPGEYAKMVYYLVQYC